LAQALERWLSQQTIGRWILIAGGGELAEVIRNADKTHHLGQKISHQLALETMRVTAKLLSALLPQASWTESLAELHSDLACEGVTIFEVNHFMQKEEPLLPGTKLPEHWDVTSDSIAGRLAVVLSADELVLVKSRLPGQGSCRIH